jgi:4-amino-4-deoxy-L-arabinose transferase-like glycosyltransferase
MGEGMHVITKSKSFLPKLWAFFPLATVLTGYVGLIITKYWMPPTTPDGLTFAALSAFPSMTENLIDRYFSFYLNRILTSPFHDLWNAYALISLLYHIGIIVFAYLIARRLAGRIQGLLAAILVAICPLSVIYATGNFTDAPCLFFCLAGFYSSLVGDDTRKVYLRYFLSGLFLTAAIFSKIYGIAFIAPIVMNLLPSRRRKNISFALIGSAVVVLFIVICDKLWLGNIFYHLDLHTYINYIKYIGGLPPRPQKMRMMFFQYAAKPQLIFYFILIFTIGIQSSRFLKNKFIANWKKRGGLFLAFAGLTLGGIFTYGDFSKPFFTVQYTYNYGVFIPWVIAFCSIIGWNTGLLWKNEEWNKAAILEWILAAVFLISIMTTGISLYDTIRQPSVGRLIYVSYLWIYILAISLVLLVDNYSFSLEHRKWARIFFIFGCSLMVWHNAFWSHDLPSSMKNDHIETKRLLQEYHALQENYPIYLIGCNIPRDGELAETLQLARLASDENLKYIWEKGDFKKLLKSFHMPFYVLTELKNEKEMISASDQSLLVLPLNEGTFYGCKFFLVGKPEDVYRIQKKELEQIYVNDSIIKKWFF